MQRFLSSSEMPNIPTINVPTQEPGPHLPLQPTAQPLHPPPSRLPPVQPIPELPSQYYQANQLHQPYQPQHPQSHNSQSNHPSSQNAPVRGGQTQNPPAYVSLSQPLPSIQTYGGRNMQPSAANCQEIEMAEKKVDEVDIKLNKLWCDIDKRVSKNNNNIDFVRDKVDLNDFEINRTKVDQKKAKDTLLEMQSKTLINNLIIGGLTENRTLPIVQNEDLVELVDVNDTEKILADDINVTVNEDAEEFCARDLSGNDPIFDKYGTTEQYNEVGYKTQVMAVTTSIFLVITFSRFVAGAVKLSTDCPKERRVAEYLFVKSCLGFIFWGMLLLLGCKKQLMNAMDNRFVEVYLVIESLFSPIWLIIGTVWTTGFRDEMIDECPFYVEEWNKAFINFALFLTAVDWIGIVPFGFYCCYVQFDKSNDDNTT
ncbi:uncharacterized protein LOC128550537 [Mercenaria mercenaria]|uniref:uncharacterized protein LOC128550537 n=1 Tax=Mercenaria mercenaria TaxID=6596 RepID=UPI00234F0A11|nr:uncharacterized protein LOC128550537 [Mercenaria mercenaria]